MENDRRHIDAQLAASRIVFGVFGFAFAGIGITLLGFLWLTPFDAFGSPPLFFRIFGSLIAICFVAVGGSTLFAAVTGQPVSGRSIPFKTIQNKEIETRPIEPSLSALNYACSNCGAQLAAKSDVSPLGDVKCSFCHQWFNIHRPTSGT